MATYRVTYRPDAGHPAGHELTDADRIDVEAGDTWLVARRTVWVIGKPRDTVIRRIAAAAVSDVTELA